METIKFTLSNDRTPKKGVCVIKRWQDIKLGEYVTTGRCDADNLLEVFFEVNEIGKSKGKNVLISTCREYCIFPDNYENAFKVIEKLENI